MNADKRGKKNRPDFRHWSGPAPQLGSLGNTVVRCAAFRSHLCHSPNWVCSVMGSNRPPCSAENRRDYRPDGRHPPNWVRFVIRRLMRQNQPNQDNFPIANEPKRVTYVSVFFNPGCCWRRGIGLFGDRDFRALCALAGCFPPPFAR